MSAMLAGCPRLGGQRPPTPFRKGPPFGRREYTSRASRGVIAPPAAALARAITRAASTQTYLTIDFLVERRLRQQAFCAYAYFRWVDDVLDAEEHKLPAEARTDRLAFLERQHALVDRCLLGETPGDVNRHEALLVDLLGSDDGTRDGLVTYIRQMMRVMDFDARRRGDVVSADELDLYTSWLATAVTEAMRHFLAADADEPGGESRYMAVTGAHILHMLRDTHDDVDAGYFNIPREVLDGAGIGPTEVHADAYRLWVRDRVQRARSCLEDGRAHFQQAGSWRYRLAGLAYIARFEWLLDRLERDRFRIRPRYERPADVRAGLNVGWQALRQGRRFGEQTAL